MHNIFESYSIFKKIFLKNNLFSKARTCYHPLNAYSLKNKQSHWSNLLFKDLIFLKLHENNIKKYPDYSNSAKFIRRSHPHWYYYNYFISFLKRALPEQYNKFSFFYDLSQQIYFYKFVKKLKLNKKKKILLPEVGLAGFPLIILKKLGFKYIFAYDQDDRIKYSIKKIWRIDTIFIKNIYNYFSAKNYHSVSTPPKTQTILTVMNSSQIDLNFFLINDFLIILQSWHSSVLNSKVNQLKKNYPSKILNSRFDKQDYRFFAQKLEQKDYNNFIKDILN
jgi:hypothetical protein